ncbi:MAG: hypothetical protein V4671_24930 [Armatimonadota bacterium]
MPKTLERPTATAAVRTRRTAKPTQTIEQTATELGARTRITTLRPGVFSLLSPRSNQSHTLTVRFAPDGSLVVHCSCRASAECWHVVELKRRHARKTVIRPFPDQLKGMCACCGDVITHQYYQVGGSTSGRWRGVVECWSHTSGSGANGVGTPPCNYREVL